MSLKQSWRNNDWELSGITRRRGTTLTSVIYDSFTSFKDEIYGDLNGDGKVNSSESCNFKKIYAEGHK